MNERTVVAVLVGVTFGLIAWGGAVSGWWVAEVVSAALVGGSVAFLVWRADDE